MPQHRVPGTSFAAITLGASNLGAGLSSAMRGLFVRCRLAEGASGRIWFVVCASVAMEVKVIAKITRVLMYALDLIGCEVTSPDVYVHTVVTVALMKRPVE